MFVPKKMHHVAFGVRDFERSIEFYTGVLGLELVFRNDSVFSRCLKIGDENSDILEKTTLTNVGFRNGAVGDLIVSMKVRQQGPDSELYVYGTEGSLWFSHQPPVGLTLHSVKLEDYNEPKMEE